MSPSGQFASLTVCRLSELDRDRGTPCGAAPPTPPGIRVRTTAVRSGWASASNVETGQAESRELVVAQCPLNRHVSGHAPVSGR